MPEEFQVKPLKFKELQGISQRQISEHHDVLYAGYVKKTNEIRSKFKTVDLADTNATYSTVRALKLEETFAVNGVKLHEGYFDSLGGDGVPKGKILDLIKEDFGSYEAWEKEFRALGISARGWVVLAYDWSDGKLHNYLCDAHNQGGVWSCAPLLILDVYEHAYFLDYATGRKNYIDAFMKNIDWAHVNQSIAQHGILEHRKHFSGS